MYVIKLILKIKYRISFLGFREIIVRLVREKTHSKLCTRKDKSLGVNDKCAANSQAFLILMRQGDLYEIIKPLAKSCRSGCLRTDVGTWYEAF